MKPARETSASGPRTARGDARRTGGAVAREQQLASRLDAIAWMARQVGHTLNNELMVVLANARWLEEEGRDDATVAELRESGERCAGLASALLRWIARVQCGERPLRLRALLDETRPLLAAFPSGGMAGPELAVEIPHRCDPVVADPERACRMLVSLAAAAREVLGACGKLRARLVQTAAGPASALELRAEGAAEGRPGREHVARRLDGAERAGGEDESALARAAALAHEAGTALRAEAGPDGRAVLAVRVPLGSAA